MRTPRLLLLGALVAGLLVACGSLLFDQSNAFPCDFSKAPGERDLACAPGDVCGVDGTCHRFVYEGPQFEGRPTLPDFSEAGGAGTLLHPRRLNSEVRSVSKSVTRTLSGVEVHTVAGEAFVFSPRLPLIERSAPPPPARVMMRAGPYLFYTLVATGQSHVQGAAGLSVPVTYANGGQTVRALRWHGTDGPRVDEPVVVLVTQDGGAGLVGTQATFTPWDVRDPDGGAQLSVLDVGLIPRQPASMPLVVVPNGILSRDPNGDFYDALEDPDTDFGFEAAIRFEGRGTLAAVAKAEVTKDGSGRIGYRVLSTFAVTNASTGPTVERLWDDCTPCDQGLIAGFYPVTDSDGLPAVDVICEDAQERTLVRVVDAPGGDETLRCIDEYVEETVPLDRIAQGESATRRWLIQDEASATGMVLGGLAGDVWLGDSPASAVPLYLDRVPFDVMVTRPEAKTVAGAPAEIELPIVLTDAYLAVDEAAAPALVQNDLVNGFRRVTLAEASGDLLAGDARPAALVHDAPGWLVLSTGQLVKYSQQFEDGGAVLDFKVEVGPQLVNGRGDQVELPLSGEGVATPDGRRSMLVAADDSLYFLTPRDLDVDAGLADQEIGPVLTPEPGALIRHLALERTPIGSDGVNRMRGYAVTSRSVHRFQYGGTPARWTTTPLVLSGGTPLEVWFDHPRGGLGRVGYQDGVVYTLPGGFQLTEPLANAVPGAAEAPRVIDYENLAGWPVALTTRGLFVAQWDLNGARLDNRFADGGVNRPMTWREVKLPAGDPNAPEDELAPWKDENGDVFEGRLFVRADPEVAPGGGSVSGQYERTFHLLLFMDEEVLEVGRHVRTNQSSSAP